jgi:hypothetical protein
MVKNEFKEKIQDRKLHSICGKKRTRKLKKKACITRGNFLVSCFRIYFHKCLIYHGLVWSGGI